MEYKEIVVVTGEPGLFQLISSKSDGAIVRALDGQTTKFVPSRNSQFTPLESIEVFTTGENVSLMEVFRAIRDHETDTPVVGASAEANAIKGYFTKIYPELDDSRVYMSDLKKMLKWYPLLKSHDLITDAEAPAVAPEETVVPAETASEGEPAQPGPEAAESAKPAPKAKKTPASPKAEAAAAAGEASKPAKPAGKTAAKKKAAGKDAGASGE